MHKLIKRNNFLFCALFVGLLLSLTLSASAHFLLNLNVRIMHVQHTDDGLRVYMRTPMPHLVADKVGRQDGATLPDAAPYTTNAMKDGQLVHFVDLEAFKNDPDGLGQLAEDGLQLLVENQRLGGTIEKVQLHRIGSEPGFATLEEAQRAVQTETPLLPPLYVGDTIVDLVLDYNTEGVVQSFSLANTLDPGLPDQDQTANLILDYASDRPQVFRSRGLMTEPVEIQLEGYGGFLSFVWEGIRHILEGLDHVLFVVCLVIGAQTLRALLLRATGFTVGHSVTLSLGFFGFVPSGSWFIPAVETGIALSIIFAAVAAFASTTNTARSELTMVLLTTLIGLLHGLGFSFVLQEILQVTSPNIWQSLLAFNLGVELGQVAIILALWPALLLCHHANAGLWMSLRIGLAGGCAAIACYWTFQRMAEVYSTLT
ncbi:HupE/UreJ family protein [Ruegeria lacuscaerulensis]|uniref:HupE/UreJ family protein n=1 Tax=Ruegeria lacuscaerulensis TaxID=55218 RepID=UPI00147BC8A6|nr:HupE/UreJ family protein [Ruegeria lacuscaerulensis]